MTKLVFANLVIVVPASYFFGIPLWGAFGLAIAFAALDGTYSLEKEIRLLKDNISSLQTEASGVSPDKKLAELKKQLERMTPSKWQEYTGNILGTGIGFLLLFGIGMFLEHVFR